MLETARALRDHGVRVRVISMHEPGSRAYEMIDDIEVIRPRYVWPERLEVLRDEGGGLPAVWRNNHLARAAFPLLMVAQTLATMRYARDYHIIHAHWTLPAMAVWAGRAYHRRPFVVTVHGSDIFQAPRIPLVGPLTRMALSRARRVIAVSRSLAEATLALGLPAHRVEVLPDGIDIDRFQPGSKQREPLILFVGSLIERKGVRYLLQALPALIQKLPEYHLAVVGDGPQRSELVQLAQSLNLATHATFAGAQSQAQIGQWMRRARLFVLPSLEEALGIVLLEALASGTPCVATQVGGIPEVVSPEVGRLVPVADPGALAEAMVAVLSDRAAWGAMSRRARAHVMENCYTWKKVASRLIEIYQAALKTL